VVNICHGEKMKVVERINVWKLNDMGEIYSEKVAHQAIYLNILFLLESM
jgi:hypothetical protein